MEIVEEDHLEVVIQTLEDKGGRVEAKIINKETLKIIDSEDNQIKIKTEVLIDKEIKIKEEMVDLIIEEETIKDYNLLNAEEGLPLNLRTRMFD